MVFINFNKYCYLIYENQIESLVCKIKLILIKNIHLKLLFKTYMIIQQFYL